MLILSMYAKSPSELKFVMESKTKVKLLIKGAGEVVDVVPDRKAVDPPPIVQLQLTDPTDPAHLVDQDLDKPGKLAAGHLGDDLDAPSQPAIVGMLVSSLHRLKDTNNSDGGFFVFPDISVRLEGTYRLRFSLFEINKIEGKAEYIKSVTSLPFDVYHARTYPGSLESTFLSRSFSDQGIRLRVRKEPRILGKRPAQQASLPTTPFSHDSSSRSLSRQEGSTIQSPIEQTGPFSANFRDPTSGYGNRPFRFHKSSHSGDSHNLNAGQVRRSALSSYNPSFYPQGQPQSPFYSQEFSFGHERVDPSTSFQPEVGDTVNWMGNLQQQQAVGRPSLMQYLAERAPPPVPPERQLPSSTPAMYAYDRGYSRHQEQSSYTSGLGQSQYLDDQRQTPDRRSSYGITQDTYSQLPSRTLPQPTQPVGGASYTTSSAPTAGASSMSSAGYERGYGAYQNQPYYHAQPPYR